MYERDLTRSFNEKLKQSTEFVSDHDHSRMLFIAMFAFLLYVLSLVSISIFKTSQSETFVMSFAIIGIAIMFANFVSNYTELPLEVLTELANAELSNDAKSYLKTVAPKELTLKDLKVVLKHQNYWLEQDLKTRRANQTQLIRSKLV